jgi:hypothetical protein
MQARPAVCSRSSQQPVIFCGIAAPAILALSNWLEVMRIHATSHSTLVVQDHSLWNRPYEVLVSFTMHRHHIQFFLTIHHSRHAHFGIPELSYISHPYVTAGVRFWKSKMVISVFERRTNSSFFKFSTQQHLPS